jgi:hypothetical protein
MVVGVNLPPVWQLLPARVVFQSEIEMLTGEFEFVAPGERHRLDTSTSAPLLLVHHYYYS